LLKAGSSNAAAGAAKISAPEARQEPYPFKYLLETTTVRAPRRLWPKVASGFAVAAIAAAGWAFYVRANTGSFPPLVQKAAVALHRALPSGSRNGSANTTSSSANNSAGTQPAESSNGSSPSANAADGGTTQGNAGTPASVTQAPAGSQTSNTQGEQGPP